MGDLSKTMMAENKGRNDASYYAHRVEMVELANEHNGNQAAELRIRNRRLNADLIALKNRIRVLEESDDD